MTVTSRIAPVVRSALKPASAAGDRIRPPRVGISILIYHRVGAGSGGEMDLEPAVFRDQLDWLRTTQRVIDLESAVAELATGDEVAPGVVLTFDDGTTDWVDVVLPALDEARLPATFYVASGFIDDQRPFPQNGAPLSWSALRELASSPLVTVGSHTHDHLLLDRLDPSDIDAELDRSIERLGSELAIEVDHFAYPKAVAGSPAAEAAVRSRFNSAVLAGTRANVSGADVHRLQRSPIQASDGDAWFRRKTAGGLGLEDDIRQLANRLRYRSIES